MFQFNYLSTNLANESNVPEAAFAGSRCFLPSAGDAVRGLWHARALKSGYTLCYMVFCHHFAPQKVDGKLLILT